jgi:NAD(P)-dependent dehydrogenase (short-subunit alcohol dehydrogenase family)
MLGASRQVVSRARSAGQGRRSFAMAAVSSQSSDRMMHGRGKTPVPPAVAGSLEGKIVWMVGGAGLIGTGIARGYLSAGATVICNSRYNARLQRLSEDLGHPDRLIAVQGSMMPDAVEDTVQAVMDMTGGTLDHVVTHSAVRWWGGASRDGDETNTLVGSGATQSLLDMSIDDFKQQSLVLPQMHFAAARLLMPRLQQVPGASYVFVTGGVGERSPIGQINNKAIWGLAAAMRAEAKACNYSGVNVEEVRVGLRFNRSAEERRADPRDTPLSDDIGVICAGLAAAPERLSCDMHVLGSAEDVLAAKQAFPVVEAM